MTLENLVPLLDELCAILHGKGCTVREVAVTYAPLTPEEALALGFAGSRGDAADTRPPPRGGARRYDSAGTVQASSLVLPSGRERTHEGRAGKGAMPSGRRTATKDACERRPERVPRRRDVRRSAALRCMGEGA